MNSFNYKARDSQGNLIVGTMDAESESDLLKNLESSGYSVVEVTAAGGLGMSLDAVIGKLKGIQRKDLILFTRQLSALLHSGTSLTISLTTIQNQTENKKFKAILTQIVVYGKQSGKLVTLNPVYI